MNPSLCETFRALSFKTFEQMGSARRVEHQPLEETFTDTNILELKLRHGTEIHSRTYNKHEEGKNGADWQWWITNSAMDSWLGLRVQAKIQNIESDSFEHLHYRSKKSKTYQATLLKRACAKEGLIPIYCLYTHQKPDPKNITKSCGSFAHAPESYGCSLVSLAHVEALQKNGESRDYKSVMHKAIPWHCLVCCSGYGGSDLPSRAWAVLQNRLEVRAPKQRRMTETPNFPKPNIGLRRRPPDYVLAAVKGWKSDAPPPNIHGVLIIREADKARFHT